MTMPSLSALLTHIFPHTTRRWLLTHANTLGLDPLRAGDTRIGLADATWPDRPSSVFIYSTMQE